MSSEFISEPLIQYLGVSSHLFFVLGFAVLFLTTFIFIYARTGNRLLTSIIALISLGLGCLWGVFPIWIVWLGTLLVDIRFLRYNPSNDCVRGELCLTLIILSLSHLRKTVYGEGELQ